MAKKQSQQAKSSKGRFLKRVLKFFCWILLLFFGVSLLQVAFVRFMNPPVTPLMWWRSLEARFSKGHTTPIRFQWSGLDEVPVEFLHYVWISEDARFFNHHGFDFIELKKSLSEAWKEKKAPRGASTITMQCARSLFLWQGRSFIRKALEAHYTILMEILLPKHRILELYVNVIEMGDGVYGIQAASRYHFDRAPRELTSDQLALLAAILPNPRYWDPNHPNDRVIRKHKIILQRAGQTPFPLKAALPAPGRAEVL